MKKSPESFSFFSVVRHLLWWTLLILPVSLVTGVLVALFLWGLEWVTQFRWTHLWIISFLPAIGILITFIYKKFGRNAEAGNNLIIDEIHEPGGGVPARMTPLVLIATWLTHLFGGSAGREGTAVQMGGSMAGWFARSWGLGHDDRQVILICGIAAGFGAVFGTPVAGAVFAIEVLAIGRIRYNALLPALIASFLADRFCASLGVQHPRYQVLFHAPSGEPWLSAPLLLRVIPAAVLFGLTAGFFAWLTHAIKKYAAVYLKSQWLIPALGGALLILAAWSLNLYDYLGLGVVNPAGRVSIVSCFAAGGAGYWSWLWKLLFTAVTLGSGFKGGEVTPLFFIGAALGNALAMLTGGPVDLFAALGFIAVFAGATNTPIACTLMGVELFGSEHTVYFAIACFTAYYFSGHRGIYPAQRLHEHKGHRRGKVRSHAGRSDPLSDQNH
jgi:H+/Cl- antiporter ClcA